MAERTRIGDLLVAAGFINVTQVQDVLARQRETGRRFGEELVAMGFVSEVQVTQMISNQLSVPWVSLYHVEFTRELLNLIPAEIAQRFCLVPVYVRKVRYDGDTLYVAMDDPTNEEALNYVRDSSGLPVRAMVAPPSEIRDAIDVYYFGLPPRSSRLVREDEEPKTQKRPGLLETMVAARAAKSASATIAERAPEPSPVAVPEAAPTSQGAAAVAAVVEAAQAIEAQAKPKAEKAKRKSAGPKMMTLTLLDGTQVRLPAPEKAPKEEPSEHDHGLTGQDLVKALRAKAQGQDVSAVLPDDRWEPLVGALLGLLLRKGIIADWEFVDEWKKHQR